MLYDELMHAMKARYKIEEDDVYRKCYEILNDIVGIIKDESIDDPECFYRIDKIVTMLNKNGIDTDFRHDFG